MKLLTVDAVADRLGISSVTVRRLIATRKLPHVRPSPRTVRVREEDVEALIRVGYRPAAPKPAGVAR